MSHGQRASWKSNKRKELWGKRPWSVVSHTADNKRFNRRLERHLAKQKVEVVLREGG